MIEAIGWVIYDAAVLGTVVVSAFVLVLFIGGREG